MHKYGLIFIFLRPEKIEKIRNAFKYHSKYFSKKQI